MLRYGFAFIALTIGGTAAAKDDLPYVLPKGGVEIPCTGTPFGKRLALGIEQEVLVTRRLTSGGASTSFQLDGGSLATQRQAALTGAVAANFGIDTARIDLDGDGRQELAVAGIGANGVANITIVRPTTSDNGANEQVGTWSLNPPTATNLIAIDLAGGDIDGSTDGREELVIALRYANGSVRVAAVNGTTTGGGAIAQANNAPLGLWTIPTAEIAGSTQLVLAVGDVLLAGRDQAVLLTLVNNNAYRYNVLRFNENAATADTRFTNNTFSQERQNSGQDPGSLTLHIADFGGSAAEEMIVHDQQFNSGQLQGTTQTLRYFTTSRDSSNAITSIELRPTAGLTNGVDTTDSRIATAVGEVDRRPDAEIVLVRSDPGTVSLRVQTYKVQYNASGIPSAVIPASGFAIASAPLVTSPAAQLSVAIGDADRDGIGDIYAAFRDNNSSGGLVTKVRRFSMARPTDPGAFPTPSTLALTGQSDFPSNLADTSALQVQVADWDNDSLLANLGTTCRQVIEPTIRSVVRHPPYWSRLQGGMGNFNAAIGNSLSNGSTQETRFDTFTSHDISAYVGVQVGGEILGIGGQVTAKATAGYNYESRRGALTGSEITNTVTESRSQDSGNGLVLLEENTYHCYDYDVVQNGSEVEASNLRSCELIRFDGPDLLRTFVASDLVTWDTITASTGGPGGTPSQWAPLHQEWASLALFRNANVRGTLATNAGAATDGLYSTELSLGGVSQPYIEIDLGEVRDITNIRVWPNPRAREALAGASLFVSESPISGQAPPTGAGVRAFTADLRTGNGFDRWNLWTRNPNGGFAPMRARYLRIQHTDPAVRPLRVAEIQVFGDVQNEPPAYPIAVCDGNANDGVFNARMWDGIGNPRRYRLIEMRGDLLWSGAPLDTAGQFDGQACSAVNPSFVRTSIWSTLLVGGQNGTGTNTWDVADSATNTVGTTTSISSSTRVGAELDLEGGAIVQAVAGGAYEWATGVTEENSNTMYWTTGLNYSGSVPGFSGAQNAQCGYRPQPFAYKVRERSNTGYEHQYTAIDYVVRDFNWDRSTNPPPAQCFPERADVIFRGDFEPASP